MFQRGGALAGRVSECERPSRHALFLIIFSQTKHMGASAIFLVVEFANKDRTMNWEIGEGYEECQFLIDPWKY